MAFDKKLIFCQMLILRHLPAFAVLFLIISCEKSNQSPAINQQKYLPVSVYTINNTNKDTVNALETMHIGYNSSNQIVTLQFYSADSVARREFFNVRYTNGRMSSIESLGSLRFDFLYNNSGLLQEARYPVLKDVYINSHYLFDNTGRVILKIDSSVAPTSVREDSLIYSYTDTTVRMRRYINWLTPAALIPSITGETQPTTWTFNKLIRSPFDDLEIDGMLFPSRVMLGASYYLTYNKVGMFRKFKYETLQGVVQITRDFEVISTLPGTDLPELVRVVTDNTGWSGGITTTYHYFLYKAVP
jgi:hypothetical protein